MRYLYLFFSSNYTNLGSIASARCSITLQDSFPYTISQLCSYLLRKYSGFNDHCQITLCCYEENQQSPVPLLFHGDYLSSPMDTLPPETITSETLVLTPPEMDVYTAIDWEFTSNGNSMVVNHENRCTDFDQNTYLVMYHDTVTANHAYESVVTFTCSGGEFTSYHDQLASLLGTRYGDLTFTVNDNHFYVVNPTNHAWELLPLVPLPPVIIDDIVD